MLKILHIIPSLQKGGAERITLDICNEIRKRKEHQVKLFTFHEANNYCFLTSGLDYNVIPSHFIPSIKGKHDVRVNELQKAVTECNPEIIHIHLFEAIIVMSAIEAPKAKWFIHFHDNMEQFKRLSFKTILSKKLLSNFYERRLVLRKYDAKKTKLIAISKNTFGYINNNLENKFKSSLLLNAIDTQRFKNQKQSINSNRILMIGSLVEKKGSRISNKNHKRTN